jgi:AcrR family transcriptional regulator
MARSSRREALLDAASRIVRRDGAGALTLDAVAAETGTSKGGVLYHFPTKDALVAGLVARLVAGFERRVAEAGDDFLDGYVRASVTGDPDDDSTAAGLTAALALSPALLDPLRDRYAKWDAQLAKATGDRTHALLVRLCLDGLWYADLLGMAPPSKLARRKLVERLLARPADPPAVATKSPKRKVAR